MGSLVEVFKAGELGDRRAHIGAQHVSAENGNGVPLAPRSGLGQEAAADVRVPPTGQVLEAKEVKAKSRVLADFVARTVTEAR